MVFSFFCRSTTMFLLHLLLSTSPLPWVARLLPCLAARRPSTMQPGSSFVHRWVFFKTRSTFLRLTRAYTSHSTVTTGLPAFQRHLSICHQHCMRQSVSSTRLSMELTRKRVFSTPWTVDPSSRSSTITTGLPALLRHSVICLLHCTCRSVELMPRTVHSSTFIIAVTAGCWVLCCISASFIFLFLPLFPCISCCFV
jgi:hypothetical protein